jgi:hypothetical protein
MGDKLYIERNTRPTRREQMLDTQWLEDLQKTRETCSTWEEARNQLASTWQDELSENWETWAADAQTWWEREQ